MLQTALLKSLAVSTPGGLTSTVSFNRSAEPANATDAANVATLTDTININGRSYTRTFDAKSRQITLQTPAGRKAVATLDERSQIAKLEVPGLAPISLTYDSKGRWTGLTTGTGADTRAAGATYNAQGFIDSVTDALKRTVRFDYDSAGRISKWSLPDGSAIALKYDANSNLTSITPPGRPEHAFAYTAINLISAYSPPDIGQVASASGNGFFNSIALFFVRLWNAIRFYVFELLHIGSIAQPEQSPASTSYAYNNDGQLTKTVRPDRAAIDFTYDNAGRLSTAAGSGERVRFSYDPKTANLASVETGDASGLTYTYDGSLPTRAVWAGAIKGTVSFSYDNDLRVNSSSVNGEPPVALEYDADGLLLRAGKLSLKVDPASGFLTGTALGDVTTAQDHNGFGEIVALRALFKERPLFVEQYDRDAVGRVIRKTETINSQTVVYTYAYDNAGRLTDVMSNGASTAHYTYDANGNRISVTGPKGAIRATYDAQDRLTQYGNINFESTPSGEWSSRSSDGKTTSYSYDAFGNLKGVSLSDGTRIEYVVDGRNRRIGKKINGKLVQGF